MGSGRLCGHCHCRLIGSPWGVRVGAALARTISGPPTDSQAKIRASRSCRTGAGMVGDASSTLALGPAPHGVPENKRYAVMKLLQDAEWSRIGATTRSPDNAALVPHSLAGSVRKLDPPL